MRRHETPQEKTAIGDISFSLLFPLINLFYNILCIFASDCNSLVFSPLSDGVFYDDRQGSLRRTERNEVLRDTAMLRESGLQVGEYSPKDIFKAFTGALFETHRNLANLLYIKVLSIVNGRCSRV